MDHTQPRADRARRVGALVGELAAVLTDAVGAHLEVWEAADLGTIEAQVQQVFRQVGRALLGGPLGRLLAEPAPVPPPSPAGRAKHRRHPVPRPPPAPGAVRIQTAGKPWWPCRDWHDHPLAHQRSS